MAEFEKSPTPLWSDLLSPDDDLHARLRAGSADATRLVQCGPDRDAVVITPLHRGLAALDTMGLPVTDGHSIIVDYLRHKLTVLVADGRTAHWEGILGVRMLSRDDYLLVPKQGRDGSLTSAWLSRPCREDPAPRPDSQRQDSLCGVSVTVDAQELRDALVAIDDPRRSAAVPR